MTARVLSYDPRYCPVCSGAGLMAARLVGDHPLALIRTVPCPAHGDARPLADLISRVCPPTPPKEAA